MTSTSSSTSHLDSILGTLAVPSEYGYYDKITEEAIVDRLKQWKNAVTEHLTELRDWIKQRGSELSVDDQAAVVCTTACFYGELSWGSPDSGKLVEEILMQFSDPSTQLLQIILRERIKPIFQANPHPHLNASTGRKLPEGVGGHLAYQDYYDGQHIQTGMYENLWHLIIPPVMTLQDDYEVFYKLQGISISQEMIKRVPKELLRRTGVDELLFTSLNTAMTNLHNPLTPSLLRAAIRTTLGLIGLCTPLGSQRRFDKLCALLGDCVIGNVWMYASRDPDSIQATIEMLPDIVELLEIGCARYLKGLIPQLTHPLLPKIVASPSSLQLVSLQALSVIVKACAPRMHRWKGTILEAVAKCWVVIHDLAIDDASVQELKKALRHLCMELGKACPSVYGDEYSKLLSLDPIFQGLLGGLR
ncbi:hypothetical protein HWV62_29056 [Athelia sp. TMB]|nr:hypothetical protein HWV62_29056 [Athelia sp. TMB]